MRQSVRPPLSCSAISSLTKQEYVKTDVQWERRVPPNQTICCTFSRWDRFFLYFLFSLLWNHVKISGAGWISRQQNTLFFFLSARTEKFPCVQVILRRHCLHLLPGFLYFSTSRPANDFSSQHHHKQYPPLLKRSFASTLQTISWCFTATGWRKQCSNHSHSLQDETRILYLQCISPCYFHFRFQKWLLV